MHCSKPCSQYIIDHFQLSWYHLDFKWCFFFSGHPKVKQLDMLHAADYTNMDLKQVNSKLKQTKSNDELINKAMQWVTQVQLNYYGVAT